MADLPKLSLILQFVYVSKGKSSTLAPRLVEKLVDALAESELWTWPTMVSIDQRPPKSVSSLGDLTRMLSREDVRNVVVRDAPGEDVEISTALRETEFALYCPVTVSHAPDSLKKVHDILLGLGEALWSAIHGNAAVGPVFSIRPLALQYARPLPPRHSTKWQLGDSAYFIDEEFHRTHPLGDREGVDRLKATPVPEGIIRDQLPGLTIIRCSASSLDGAKFASLRHVLEVWMSSVLRLGLHPEFNDKGDQRLTVGQKGDPAPYTLFDPMRGIGFVTAVGDSGDLDDASRRQLADVLATHVLNNGRRVRQGMVVFPTRDAAIRHLDEVRAIGAAGAVYVGDDKRLWNPSPEGNWIRVDWSAP